MNNWFYGVVCVCALLLAYAGGWIVAHGTISWECHNVGTFYVGEKVFDCKEKSK
jgi:hypothetical protein